VRILKSIQSNGQQESRPPPTTVRVDQGPLIGPRRIKPQVQYVIDVELEATILHYVIIMKLSVGSARKLDTWPKSVKVDQHTLQPQEL